MSPSRIAGTVSSHRWYLLLHQHLRPAEFPAKLTPALYPALGAAQLEGRRLQLEANLAYFSDGGSGRDEATLFDVRRRRTWKTTQAGALNIAALDLDAQKLRIDDSDGAVEQYSGATASDDVYALVCTHAQRDCRCGETGGRVVQLLRELSGKMEVPVRIGEVGHVGQHKYAANVLIYPYADWVGNISTAEDVEQLLEHISELKSTPPTDELPGIPDALLSKWRGGRGWTKEQQLHAVKDDTWPADLMWMFGSGVWAATQ